MPFRFNIITEGETVGSIAARGERNWGEGLGLGLGGGRREGGEREGGERGEERGGEKEERNARGKERVEGKRGGVGTEEERNETE